MGDCPAPAVYPVTNTTRARALLPVVFLHDFVLLSIVCTASMDCSTRLAWFNGSDATVDIAGPQGKTVSVTLISSVTLASLVPILAVSTAMMWQVLGARNQKKEE